MIVQSCVLDHILVKCCSILVLEYHHNAYSALLCDIDRENTRTGTESHGIAVCVMFVTSCYISIRLSLHSVFPSAQANDTDVSTHEQANQNSRTSQNFSAIYSNTQILCNIFQIIKHTYCRLYAFTWSLLSCFSSSLQCSNVDGLCPLSCESIVSTFFCVFFQSHVGLCALAFTL